MALLEVSRINHAYPGKAIGLCGIDLRELKCVMRLTNILNNFAAIINLCCVCATIESLIRGGR